MFYHLLNSIHVPPPPFSIFFLIYRFCHLVLPSFKQYTCSTASFFQSFFLYTGSAILFYHLLNSIHVPSPPFFNLFFLYTGSAILFYHLLNSIHVPCRPLFSIFFPIYRFCHPVLPSFKQYTCSAATLFSIFFPIYRFCHPLLLSFKQYTCSAAPFFNLFSDIQVLPFWAKFFLVWFSLGFDTGLVQNHKR